MFLVVKIIDVFVAVFQIC